MLQWKIQNFGTPKAQFVDVTVENKDFRTRKVHFVNVTVENIKFLDL